jgi:hypothetical protein
MERDPIYMISTRNSLYGFHKPILRRTDEVDVNCTKTTLLGFTKKEHATRLIQMIEDTQRQGFAVNRLMQNSSIDLRMPTPFLGSLLPLETTELLMADVEKICLLHVFDLCVGFDVQEVPPDILDIGYYEYLTREWPNRSIVDRFMNDMYH